MDHLIVLDSNGIRLTTYIVGINGASMDALKDKAGKEFPSATLVEDDGTLFKQLLDSSKCYKDGAVVDRPQAPVDPSVKAQQEAAAEQQAYNKARDTFVEMLQNAMLRGDTQAVQKIQQDFLAFQNKFISSDDDE